MTWTLVSVLMAVGIGPMGPDAPAREPQLAVSGSTVALAFGAGHSIYFSRSADSGKSFTPPVKVAGSAIIPLTRHRGPRIAFAGSAIVITAVTGKTAAEGTHAHGLPSDGDLMAWRSTDGGTTWSKGTMVNDVPGAATEGLHGLATDGKGRLFAAWLDKRDHGTRLYGSRSDDGGLTWSKNMSIYASPDGTICECCHPSVAFGPDGTILVMWRNWLGGSRDMYLARSSGGGRFSSPQKLGEGTWKLNACPMDGGGIAVSANGIVTAWRRDHSVFLDRPGDPEKEIGQGTDVALSEGRSGVYVIWSTPETVQLLVPGAATPRNLGEKGSFPSVAALASGGAVVAWENDGKVSVRLVK
jgi:hypothetical protein